MSTIRINEHVTARFAAIHITRTYGAVTNEQAMKNPKVQDMALSDQMDNIKKMWGESSPVFWENSNCLLDEKLPEYVCSVWLVSDTPNVTDNRRKGSHVVVMFFLHGVEIAEMAGIRSKLVTIFKQNSWYEIAKDFE